MNKSQAATLAPPIDTHSQAASERRRSWPANLSRYLWRRPLAVASLAVIGLLAALAIAPGLIAPYDPVQLEMGERLLPPGGNHPFGTDNFGRDILSRVIYGARISLATSLAVLISAALAGSAVGMLGGYAGGWVDDLLMRIADVFMAFPVILLAMVIVVVLQPGLVNTTVALIIVWWPAYARLMRAQVLAVKRRPFVEAALAGGAPAPRILLRHILPNTLAPLLVQATMDMGYVVLTAAGLGFLGLGAQPPAPEWGAMISDGRKYFLEAAWIPIFPGLAIALTVLAFNLLGDELRDWLDPRRSDLA
jgi:peptide/nickel transport system permease protein